MAEHSNREIALRLAIQNVVGHYDENVLVDDPFGGKAPKFIPPTVEDQLQRAEQYLLFLEGDEVA